MSALDILGAEASERLRPQEQPRWISPILATLTDVYFSDPGWIYERKLDGQRALAFRKGGTVRLVSRNRNELSATYPEVVEALGSLDTDDFIADGEIVAFEGRRTSFARLQGRMQITNPVRARATGIEVFYYLLDLVHLDGYDTTALALRDRKRLLRRAFSFEDPLRYLPHRNEKGEEYLKEACQKRWEGLIAKRAAARYKQARSRDWLKFKCVNQQELVIGGYTEPQGQRERFGALLVGYYRGRDLMYAGKVGTGYSQYTLQSLGERLEPLERKTSPFANSGEIREKRVHWVAPELVGEFGFTEWTEDGKLRHPRYLGLRRDKDPREVVREVPS
ncbi:non-homologous end-joining DNA ligase [Streptomyces gobiensis]|uniref:non-homologous end-joining DNA ligase n=1 Tax=Streptomyces gobiensis TaxID=2875706 RepID=UPI001E480AD7|nr:non-homologous end-joining DNA ligase [Streptomyces gobiensis]UGY94601.1 non-homologous end-joining DNA ligase [Streptomyces gobiensis]